MIDRPQQVLRELLARFDAIPGERAHAERVAVLAVATAERLGLSDDDLLALRIAAGLHDWGKLHLEGDLLERYPPSDGDWATIILHTVFGADAPEVTQFGPQVSQAVRSHHERWDGKGYPDGLTGEHAPELARILAVAEAFDGSMRPLAYRQALTHEEAVAMVQNGAGTLFDPRAVDALLAVLPLIQPMRMD